MDSAFDLFDYVVLGKDCWHFKVRVVSTWSVSSFVKPDNINSIEMVLVNDKVCYWFWGNHSCHRQKIVHVSVPEQNCGSCDAPSISRYGFKFSTISEISNHTLDYDYLVDIIGLLTAISTEREYVRDGKVTKMLVIELTDHSGKVECALFGDYVDLFQDSIGKAVVGMKIVVVQFAKLKMFRDKVSIQNVLNATRVLVNRVINEIDEFKKCIAFHGIESLNVVTLLGPPSRPSAEDDFLRLNPKKTVVELVGMSDVGTFIVGAVIDGFVDCEDLWYPTCRCHRSVSADSGAYYCKGCDKHVFSIVPRLPL
ncbi:hypothetical protein TSUD_397480 [Trifolium subterraneum]|uniref:Replication factor A C-terminal domain-containing protein n=1 Tax=Trifolium subterraneum TaxID=3900 RepID=A0A2Z6P8X5_TRISU|nr:hypothetical protein TSUD_397480 [Trifolium subterraneum]